MVELLAPEDSDGLVCESEPGKGSIFSFNIYNHLESSLPAIKSESNFFEKHVRTPGLKLVISSLNLIGMYSENFEMIEEKSDDGAEKSIETQYKSNQKNNRIDKSLNFIENLRKTSSGLFFFDKNVFK